MGKTTDESSKIEAGFHFRKQSKYMEKFSVYESSGQIFQPVENSSAAV